MTFYNSWWHTNKVQFGHTEHLNLILEHLPEWRIFDSTGIVPRANNVLAFYGPSDPEGNANTTKSLEQYKPEIVVYTPKLRIGGPNLIIFLHKNYEEVNPGFWILKAKLDDYNELYFPKWNYNLGTTFGYDYLPEVRYFRDLKAK